MSKSNGFAPVRSSKMIHNGSLEILETGTKDEVDKPVSRPSSSSRRAPSTTVEDLTRQLASYQLGDDNDDDIVAMANLDSGALLSGNSLKVKAVPPSLSSQAINRAAPPSGGASAVGAAKNAKSKNSSSSEESSDDDDETRKAPNQLIMEFLDCVMNDDIENGLKLCKMILLYEPDNSRALKFLPLLQQKKEQDDAETSGEDDSEDSEGESDEESGDDSDDSGSDDSSEEEEDDDVLPEQQSTQIAGPS